MPIRRWDPLRDLLTLQERMNRLFEHSLVRGHLADPALASGSSTPLADVYETAAPPWPRPRRWAWGSVWWPASGSPIASTPALGPRPPPRPRRRRSRPWAGISAASRDARPRPW